MITGLSRLGEDARGARPRGHRLVLRRQPAHRPHPALRRPHPRLRRAAPLGPGRGHARARFPAAVPATSSASCKAHGPRGEPPLPGGGGEVLQRRFSETRRPHPAGHQPARDRGHPRGAGGPARPSARWRTSSSTPPTSRSTSSATTSASTTTCAAEVAPLVLSVMSFGYKYGAALRGGPRVRRALPAQPELRAAAEAPHRRRPRRWCAT